MSTSRSFPPGDPALDLLRAQPGIAVVLPGAALPDPAGFAAVLVELGHESLAEHAGEEGGIVLGIARWRNGDDAPSPLVELVTQKGSAPAAVAAARAALEAAGLQVALCDDQPGRILDRLLRPKYNAALRFLDEGLATQADMDLTCRLGLGYPDGPVERLLRGGLHHHHAASAALFEAFGTPGYAPARRSVVAARRRR
ncbi:3-hydroxyacyl-CoA dehydrogenase family protein [Roseococcus sp. DSY-14]|uniref:3-hydroxyacyl-CoA dehydrogenase family protein n=1 Tax=Roseococcus sp. DSY-14 TaxID=3369650 RepID=UPI00387A8AF6